MKVNPETIIFNKQSFLNINFFLISGNEQTYINKISDKIISGLKKLNFLEIKKYDDGIKIHDNAILDQNSLFSEKKILIFKNSKGIDIKLLEKIEFKNTAIIIIDKNIKNSSPIKKCFDLSKKFVSIACYKLNRESKKRIADFFFNSYSISLEDAGYWYFLDHTNDKYMAYENEIYKIINFNKKKIPLKDLYFLISQKDSPSFDSLFFLILFSNKQIILSTQTDIQSLSDAYILIQRVKFYLDLLMTFDNIDTAERIFPKYLFIEKDKFLKVYKKISYKKISKVVVLLNRAELMLRKNDNLYLSIIQRFLINLKKIIN